MSGKNQRKKLARKQHNQNLNELKVSHPQSFNRLRISLYSKWTDELVSALNSNSPSLFDHVFNRVLQRAPDYSIDFTIYSGEMIQMAAAFRLSHADSVIGPQWRVALESHFGRDWMQETVRLIALKLSSVHEIQRRADEMNTNLWWIIGLINEFSIGDKTSKSKDLDVTDAISSAAIDALTDLSASPKDSHCSESC